MSSREYHARREQERWEERETLRRETLRRAHEAIQRRAPQYPAVRAVHLFGSILQPGRFHELSDVDVAVDCDDLETETPFWRSLEEELERNVDLRLRVGPIARAVEESGELCYEREMVGPRP